jgi:hypothetical protein
MEILNKEGRFLNYRYEVSNFGRIYNIQTGREMVLSPTLQGILTVGLMSENHDGYPNRQYRRSVKRLVAEAFVPGETDLFDTPIQLDGIMTISGPITLHGGQGGLLGDIFINFTTFNHGITLVRFWT